MIAFIVRGERPNGQIWIVPMSGQGQPAGEPAKIDAPQGVGQMRRLAGWAPGNRIGIVSVSQEFALYTVPAAGGKAAAVKIGGYATQPRWSPDGKRIYYIDEDGQIAFIPAEGGNAFKVPIQSATDFQIRTGSAGLAISPDGHRIAFSATKRGIPATSIWTLPIDGGAPMRLTGGSESFNDVFPSWSPDGRSIAFVRSHKDDRYWLGLRAEIYTLPAAGGEAQRITDETDEVNYQPIAWSPDGTMLAYVSRDVTYLARDWKPAAGSWDVWDGSLKVYSLRERRSRAVTRVQGTIVNAELAWSPDSRRIAYNDSYRNLGPIRVVSLDDGIAKEVETNLVNTRICNLSWSRDGSKLAFMGWHDSGPELWLMEGFLPLAKGK
jgi:Tol biopolymer transport system component